MKKRNERTSKRIAAIAGKVLAADVGGKWCWTLAKGEETRGLWFKWSDIRALAASVLTQAPDRQRIGFSHWGQPPGEKPGPRRPVHRVEFDDAKPPTTKRKNGVVKTHRWALRKRPKKKNRAK